MFDLLIRNGVLLNPETGEETKADVGIKEGKVSYMGCGAGKEAERTIDVWGAYVFPGWIDFHTHLFTGGSGFGVNADLLFSSGTTMAVDMGTAGSANYRAFRQSDIIPRNMRIKSFLNLSPVGQPGAGISEPLDEKAVKENEIRQLTETYRDEILGIKVRISKEIVGDEGLAPLARAVTLGETLGIPVCVHTTNPPEETDKIVRMLRPGDIYSHVYHNKGQTILTEDGAVKEAFYEAQKRGVILELGNGRMNFSFQVAKKAMEAGLYPDIISSDATARTFGNTPDMKDLSFVASKLWNMGMPLHRVINAMTKTPAACLGLSDRFGSLEIGRTADITVARVLKQTVRFVDSEGGFLAGDRVLSPEMTVVGGRIYYLQGQSGYVME